MSFVITLLIHHGCIKVVRGKRWNQLFKFFFLLGKSFPPVFLEMNQLENAWAGVSRMILAHVGRGMLFADSPGVGPVPLRCGLARGEQSLNYLLGAWRILWAGGPRAIPEKKPILELF